jgi:hypothetical protein
VILTLGEYAYLARSVNGSGYCCHTVCERCYRAVELPSREGSRKIPIYGIFPGAKVIRGQNWDWDDQDGGAGKRRSSTVIWNFRSILQHVRIVTQDTLVMYPTYEVGTWRRIDRWPALPG